MTRVWDEAVAAPRWGASLVWIHGDVQPGNLIVREARVSFRNAIGADDATWARGKGWVLAPALQGLRYYRDSRPEFAAAARHRIDAVLADRT